MEPAFDACAPRPAPRALDNPPASLLEGFEVTIFVACTCRSIPHCPNCNASVRVPYSNLERGSALTALLIRMERKERAVPRENLNRLAEGKTPCPACGEMVMAMHDRPCVGESLASMGLSLTDREKLLGRISFPE